jgi:3-phenylpropionate/cinnamic acid dioxygenase small subunit
VDALDDEAARRTKWRSGAMTASALAPRITAAACAPGTSLYGEVLEFLYREADLLDSYRFEEWLALFAPEIRYDMPVRTNQFRAAGEGFQQMAFFDDNFASLKTRVKRLETEFAWAETPPSRTRHFVSNVLVAPGERDDELAVRLNFMITRTRSDHGYQMFTGRREDTLRRVPGGRLEIVRRRIFGDQTVITNTNLSVLF